MYMHVQTNSMKVKHKNTNRNNTLHKWRLDSSNSGMLCRGQIIL